MQRAAGCCTQPTQPLAAGWQRQPSRPCRRPSVNRRCIKVLAKKDADDEPPVAPQMSSLEQTIRRKQAEVGVRLEELGMEGQEQRLQDAVASPADPPYRLARLVSEITQMQGRAAILVEVARANPTAPSSTVAAAAQMAIQCGADAICVRCDSIDTAEAYKDLFSVVQVSRRVPVLAKDWCVHPLQVVDAKEAGAAGFVGVIAQVNGKGTALLSSFAARIGLDAPVEVVNAREVEGLAQAGVVFYGINLQVGLSIAVPGFAADMAHGLLGALPFGALSLVGVTSLEQARKARLSGADVLLIKKEMVDAAAQEGKDMRTLLDQVLYVTSGDD